MKFNLTDVLELPVAERLRLVEAIWDSIAECPEGLGLSSAQRADLKRRLEAYRNNPDAGFSWSEVRESIPERG